MNIISLKHICLCVCCGWLAAVSSGCASGSTSATETETQSDAPVGLNQRLTNDTCRNDCFRPLDRAITRWMQRNNIRGVSFALMKHDRLIYAHGYGWANREDSIPADVGHVFRVASASKLLTAVGIMRLKENGALSLDDRVFGPQGILCDSIYAAPADKRIEEITVRQLLCHKGGFGRRWGDPMFNTADLVRQDGLPGAPTPQQVVCHVLRQRLSFQPGTRGSYSNVGYLILSLVIEKLSGESYEEYIRREVLAPAGCYDMHIAGNLYADRRPNEVKYYGHDMLEPAQSFNGDSAVVTREYGGIHVSGLLGAGGWVASSVELLRFVAAVDGDKGIKDIISPADVHRMTPARTKEDGNNTMGWAYCEKDGRRIRTGTMSGTIAYVESRPDGLAYVLLTNTSHYRGPRFTQAVGRMIDAELKRIDSFPECDFFQE